MPPPTAAPPPPLTRDVAGWETGLAFGLGTVLKIARSDRTIGAPLALLAVMSTLATTAAPYGSAFAGLNTRTVFDSAQLTVPLIALPPILTENALAVAARSIASVNRTEIAASSGVALASSRGRNRTTPGDLTVRTAIDWAARPRPSRSRTPLTTSL